MPTNSVNNSSNPPASAKQIAYRDARFTKQYDGIWQSVGKCVFCDLRDKYIVFEENNIALTVSLFAYIDGHMMIIPRRHVRSAKELTEREWTTVRKFTYIAKKLLRKVHGITGVNYVLRDGGIVANSTVSDHLHMHVIPFDDPSLCTWNYRQLRLTPQESASKYRTAGKAILRHNQKFNDNYRQPYGIKIICDAVISNLHDEIMFQHRADGMKLDPDWLTLPGGGVSNFSSSLEDELLREIAEETGVLLAAKDLKLISSRLSQLRYLHTEPHLRAPISTPVPFLWNSYQIQTDLPPGAFTAADDCEAIEWIPRRAVADHPRVSPELKRLIAGLPL